MNRTQTLRTTLTILSAVAVCAAADASAAPTENLPGSACFVVGSADVRVNTNGEIENYGTGSATVVCPLERPVGSPFARYLSGRAFVVDRHAWYGSCCRARSKNPGGNNVSSPWKCSTGSSTSYQILDTDQIYDGYSWSHFFLECTLPGTYGGSRSKLMTYRGNQS